MDMSSKTQLKTNYAKKAALFSIIPGFGQFFNKQYIKGIIFLVLTISFFIAFADMLNIGFWGLFTLGEIPQLDHSIILLIDGILTLLVTVIGLGIYAFNIYDAYTNGKKRDQQIALNSVREQYQNLIDNGFPYLIVSP